MALVYIEDLSNMIGEFCSKIMPRHKEASRRIARENGINYEEMNDQEKIKYEAAEIGMLIDGIIQGCVNFNNTQKDQLNNPVAHDVAFILASILIQREPDPEMRSKLLMKYITRMLSPVEFLK